MTIDMLLEILMNNTLRMWWVILPLATFVYSYFVKEWAEEIWYDGNYENSPRELGWIDIRIVYGWTFFSMTFVWLTVMTLVKADIHLQGLWGEIGSITNIVFVFILPGIYWAIRNFLPLDKSVEKFRMYRIGYNGTVFTSLPGAFGLLFLGFENVYAYAIVMGALLACVFNHIFLQKEEGSQLQDLARSRERRAKLNEKDFLMLYLLPALIGLSINTLHLVLEEIGMWIGDWHWMPILITALIWTPSSTWLLIRELKSLYDKSRFAPYHMSGARITLHGSALISLIAATTLFLS